MAYSTIINKKKICKTCRKSKYIFSDGNCKECSIVVSTNKRVAEYDASLECESVNNLIDDLDAVFSKYIRKSNADKDGLVQCFTCPIKLPVSEIQNGHFIHRTDLATRFLEDNCKPQCPNCNRIHNEDSSIFANKLEQEKKGITQWLLEQSRQVFKPTRDELKQLLIEYRFKLKLLK